ncbi:hypothetical protein J421_5862 (plasmid) [Gemmatirosa kalamazoonensis]|uniref:Gylcosyl hydrolase 115 C-terminal domain-containing protein n=1 Tax=Gemmatirosa kalamazoonensis TaxID=861299 RepID=W0RSF1_9BACT|nr:glycosyl hydrolase 115 family protein [Gemmatirosa kalamazoonensis]AHG93397.1 hypothetical protein J421_5862 [Gemmatirosa kalamazoonensis]
MLACAAGSSHTAVAQAPPIVATTGGATDVALVRGGRAAAVWYDPADAAVVGVAAHLFADDVARVAGVRPVVARGDARLTGAAVIVGTLGHSRLVDALVAAGKLDVRGVRGQWESFVVTIVADAAPGVPRAVVVAGSDRRGTAFGVLELSRQIGVSPWVWWSDVAPAHRDALFVRAGAVTMGPPSVKYRGIFLNDEDWGLQPWAARTFEPETGDVGPKTYARVFELLLRLKANMLWPAMHPSTKAFNLDPRNRLVADSFAIVMGSSHAEPMLRNNVGEWTAPAADYDYSRNPAGVAKYWEERVAANGKFENVYTLGMRGIHDSGIRGASTTAGQVALLERIFADQRALLAKHVNPDVTRVAQAFTPYKEVLPVYRAGLKVPDDVTIVWPDDNFGYVRAFPTPDEQRRTGGSGVYYHLSYLGAPLSYLWLYTTPPALVWEEMSKAYDHGARTEWIANVGDLKPAEIGIDLFLQMAWDARRWTRETIATYLGDWAVAQFGAPNAPEIAGILAEHFRLAYQRRPEHLQWWLPGDGVRSNRDLVSPLTEAEVWDRLAAYDALVRRLTVVERTIPARLRDAFFELVAYPVRGAALANARYFYAELYAQQRADATHDRDTDVAGVFAARARAADARLVELTRHYNEEVAGGKWRGMVALEPPDNQWRTMRIAPLPLPAASLAAADTTLPARYQAMLRAPRAPDDAASDGVPNGTFSERGRVVSIEAEHYTARVDRGVVGWRVVPGLGRTGSSVAVFPTTAPSVEPGAAATAAPRLEYRMDVRTAGTATLTVQLVPTFPIVDGRGLRLAVGLDDAPPQPLVVDASVDSRAWARGVLDNTISGAVTLEVPNAGAHVLKLYMVDPGVVVDRLVLDLGGLRPSWLGPVETDASGLMRRR